MEENKKIPTSRTERRMLEDEKEKTMKLEQDALEKKRQELKSIIFDNNPNKKEVKKEYKKAKKENVFKPEVETKKINTTEKKPTKTNIFLSITVVISVLFTGFMIYDSFNQENQIYQIINAFLILLITIFFVASFKKIYVKHKTMATVITAILLIILMLFNTVTLMGIIKLPKQSAIPDFSNTTLSEAIAWTEANNIKFEQSFEYSDVTEKYDVISQSEKAGTLTKQLEKIKLTVSNGPDYNKEVVVTDMEGWNIDDAVKVIDENFLNSVTVNFEDNKEIKRDTIINQSKSGTMKRNDAIVFKVSIGDKNALKPINIKDMKNMTTFKATLYLNRNAIDYELKYDFSNSVKKGNVISSSVKKGTKVSPGDKITLTISKGKKIVVPELENMKFSEVTKWLTGNNLKINYSDKYDNKVKSGNVISATYKKGDIIEEDTTIGIVVSKGKLLMQEFKSLADFKTWAEKYSIKYEVKEEFNNDVKKGDVIKFSIEANKSIDPDSGVTVYVSKGKAIEIPNFVGKTKSEIQKQCDNLKISCSFTTEYSASVKEGNAISQSKKVGEQIAEGDSISIAIATSKKNNTTSSGSNKPSSGGSTGGSGNTGGGNVDTCDKSRTKQVWLNASGSVLQTQQLIKNQNPGIKFNFITIDPGYGTTGSITKNTTIKYDGKFLNYCDTYVIEIIER